MSSIKKFAVLSMLVVVLFAFNVPASAQIGIGSATAATTAASSLTSAFSSTATAAGFGAFGGFGFPFNWGFSRFGIGGFPFNWGLGAGLGTFGLGWNQFSPCFGTGSFFSPCFLGTGCFQGLPFILGSPGGCVGPGFGVTPWMFGLGGCTKSAPLFFGAHGFGFPFTLGGIAASLIPPVCAPPIPAALPACLPAATAVCQGLPFILGSAGGCVGPGFGVTPWMFGLGGCTNSAPLFFGAHGFGFPFTLGGIATSLIPAPTLC
ncbi:hypothetical protein [Methanocella sp. MCL-LM]|uniref:hypothetical protein n=1 Tax=Methanocella sp. MCL-LM TaxID=3412035 RepID=UPI003C796BB5